VFIAILVACALLLLGALLRSRVPGLRRVAMPASLVGGLVGLLIIKLVGWGALESPVESAVAGALVECQRTFRSWPIFLVAVIFAGLLLDRRRSSSGNAFRGALREGVIVWIIVLGQVFLGILVTWLLISPATGVPVVFGHLIEIGWAGGHGTAAALGAVFAESETFPEGRDLSMFMATAGLLAAVVLGVLYVNIAIHRGWTATARRAVSIEAVEEAESVLPGATTAIAPRSGRLPTEAVDPLALQCALVGLALGLGWLLQSGFVLAGQRLLDADLVAFVEKIPLFLFSLVGGLLIRWTLALCRSSHLVDGAAIRRIMATAMEFLIVAALASLQIEVVLEHAFGLSILIAIACVWTTFCLFVLSPHLLPRRHWFELGIINYGMSTGTTAQGMMLLRMVDAELETDAAQEYALGAPFSAPFIGGGVLTVAMPFILDRVGPVLVIVVSGVLLIGLYAMARWLRE